MIVIADTSPLNYLIQIQSDWLLPELYGRIIIPDAVMRELRQEAAPLSIQAWLAPFPPWVEIQSVSELPDLRLASLGPGERKAIQLAQIQRADLLLMDERKGRLEARSRGLRTTGTLGVLLTVAEMKLIDAAPIFRRLLHETSFRIAKELETNFLRQLSKLENDI